MDKSAFTLLLPYGIYPNHRKPTNKPIGILRSVSFIKDAWHKILYSPLMPFAKFDYSLDYKNLDLRKQPERYRTGVGEQGVLLVEPYKSEILPYWKFKTPDIAKASAAKIYKLFLAYKKERDFTGMDMARKFLQMGYTRSRRYANHKGGKKYDGPVPDDKKGQSGAHGREQLPLNIDEVKAQSASVFYDVWQKAAADKTYQRLLKAHKELYKQ